MSEITISTKEEIFEALKEELRRTYPHTKAINVIMDIEYLMEAHTKEVLEDLLEKGHGGGNWRRLVMELIARFDYE